jgi:hypothetical protein
MPAYKKSFIRKLRKVKIRHFDKLIHDQPKEWLIKNFSEGADEYPVNVSMLFRNIVWQMRERVKSGNKPPFKELIRTFWYMYIKPTLSRCDSLNEDVNQYAYLSGVIVDMVKKYDLMRYKDIGFRDESKAHRRVGKNANIIIFSEKTSEWDFLTEIADKHEVSVIALGKQPSVMNIEYFVDEIRKAGWNLRTSFYLFNIVDFDTSGWILKDALVDDLNFYGINNIHMTDLITPDMLEPDELNISKYTIPVKKEMETKNRYWVEEVKERNFKNEKYLFPKEKAKKKLYGFESTAVSTKRITEKLEAKMVPVLGKKEKYLKIYELKELLKDLDNLMLYKLRR